MPRKSFSLRGLHDASITLQRAFKSVRAAGRLSSPLLLLGLSLLFSASARLVPFVLVGCLFIGSPLSAGLL